MPAKIIALFGKEGHECIQNRLRVFFHHEMARLANARLHMVCPAAPQLGRIATFGRKPVGAV